MWKLFIPHILLIMLIFLHSTIRTFIPCCFSHGQTGTFCVCMRCWGMWHVYYRCPGKTLFRALTRSWALASGGVSATSLAQQLKGFKLQILFFQINCYLRDFGNSDYIRQAVWGHLMVLTFQNNSPATSVVWENAATLWSSRNVLCPWLPIDTCVR